MRNIIIGSIEAEQLAFKKCLTFFIVTLYYTIVHICCVKTIRIDHIITFSSSQGHIFSLLFVVFLDETRCICTLIDNLN